MEIQDVHFQVSINLDSISHARLAQLVARRSHNPEVVGSIPTLCKLSLLAPLAQSVALWSYVPAAGGSKPPWSRYDESRNDILVSLVGQDPALSPP